MCQFVDVVDLLEFNVHQDLNAFGKTTAEMKDAIIHTQTQVEFVGKVWRLRSTNKGQNILFPNIVYLQYFFKFDLGYFFSQWKAIAVIKESAADQESAARVCDVVIKRCVSKTVNSCPSSH